MDRTTVTRVLFFTSAASGPAMLIVLVLWLTGSLTTVDAVLDLVVLLLVGALSVLAIRLTGPP
jgi:hypothetical protein